jgi:hypothetical protein
MIQLGPPTLRTCAKCGRCNSLPYRSISCAEPCFRARYPLCSSCTRWTRPFPPITNLFHLEPALASAARHWPSLKGKNPSTASHHNKLPPHLHRRRRPRNHGYQYGGREDARAHAAVVCAHLRADHNSDPRWLDREPYELQAVGRE